MAKPANTNLMVLLLALVLSGIFVSAGITSHEMLTVRAKEQATVTESIVRWKRSYRALAGTQDLWEKAYRPASGVRDLLSIVNLLSLSSYGLRADTDTLVLRTDTAVMSNGVDLALTKLCLATGGDSFVVEAANYDALLQGVAHLSNRRDVFVDNISILGDKDIPQARFGELCVYLRSE